MVLEDLCNGTLGGCNLTSQYGPQTHNETFRQTLGFLLAVSSGICLGTLILGRDLSLLSFCLLVSFDG